MSKSNRVICILQLSILLFFSCELFDSSKIPLSNDQGNNSELDLNLSTQAIMPPVNVSFLLLKTEAGFDSKIYWDSVPYASGYKIYHSSEQDGEFSFLAQVSSPSYEKEEFIYSSGTSSFASYYKITSLSSKGKESGFSVPVKISIDNQSIYSGVIIDPTISKGTLPHISLSWTPPENVAYYKIYRIISESDVNEIYTLLENQYIPTDSTLPIIEYKDLNAKSGLFYDYSVVPVNQYGSEGVINKGFNAGYILPQIQNFEVSNGTSYRSPASGTQVEGQIELYWDIYPYVSSATKNYRLGEPCDLLGYDLPDFLDSEDDFGFYVSYTPSNPHFSNLVNTVFLPNFLPNANDPDLAPLTALEKVEDSATRFSYLDTHINDAKRGRAYKYTLKVINKSYPAIQFENSWYKYYYFKVSSKFVVAGEGQFESNHSNLFRGLVVNDAEAPKFEFDRNDIFTILSTEEGSNKVSIKIRNPGYLGSIAPDSYRLYKRIDGGIKYDLVHEWTEFVTTGAALEYTETLSSPVSTDALIPYRFSMLKDGKESAFSSAKYLTIE